jgi:hypothetical protein
MEYYPELTIEDCRYFLRAVYRMWHHPDVKKSHLWAWALSTYEKTNEGWDFVDFERYRGLALVDFAFAISQKLTEPEIRAIKRFARGEKNVRRQETF